MVSDEQTIPNRIRATLEPDPDNGLQALLRIPSALLRRARLSAQSEVTLVWSGTRIVIEPPQEAIEWMETHAEDFVKQHRDALRTLEIW